MIKPLTAEQRDALEAESRRREEILATAQASECAECGSRMTVVTQGGDLALRCARAPAHQGHRKQKSLTQLHDEGVHIPYVSDAIERKRRKRMLQELETEGVQPEESRALAQTGDRFPITLAAATKIVDLFYPDKSLAAKTEAAILCAQHNLNPLPSRKEVYIVTIPKLDKDIVILGIAGHRVMARRKSAYAYIDDHLMTKEEVEARGEEIGEKVWVQVSLQLPDGHILRGVSNFPKKGELIGEDKGNTRYDMAAKRAEAKALAKIEPPENLPAPVGLVIEGVYMDITDVDLPKLTGSTSTPPRPSTPARPTPPRQVAAPAPAAQAASTPPPAEGPPPPSPEHEKLWGLLDDAGFLTPDRRLRKDKAEELRKLLTDHAATKLSELEGENLLRFQNKLLDLAIVRVDGEKEKQSQLPADG